MPGWSVGCGGATRTPSRRCSRSTTAPSTATRSRCAGRPRPTTSAAGDPGGVPPPLGSKQIEGIEAGGMRRTETIPAGRIGNDRPIVVTDERWESPELKLIMLSEHHDPRTGDVEYRLTNVSRAEPPHDLFTVPPDYKIVDAPPPPPPPPPPPGRPDQPL